MVYTWNKQKHSDLLILLSLGVWGDHCIWFGLEYGFVFACLVYSLLTGPHISRVQVWTSELTSHHGRQLITCSVVSAVCPWSCIFTSPSCHVSGELSAHTVWQPTQHFGVFPAGLWHMFVSFVSLGFENTRSSTVCKQTIWSRWLFGLQSLCFSYWPPVALISFKPLILNNKLNWETVSPCSAPSPLPPIQDIGATWIMTVPGLFWSHEHLNISKRFLFRMRVTLALISAISQHSLEELTPDGRSDQKLIST